MPVPIEEAIFANIIIQNLESLYKLFNPITSLSLSTLTLIEWTEFAFSHWSKVGLIHLAEYEFLDSIDRIRVEGVLIERF